MPLSLEEVVEKKQRYQGEYIQDGIRSFEIIFTRYRPEYGSVAGEILWSDTGVKTRVKGIFIDEKLLVKEIAVTEGDTGKQLLSFFLAGIEGKYVTGSSTKGEGQIRISLVKDADKIEGKVAEVKKEPETDPPHMEELEPVAKQKELPGGNVPRSITEGRVGTLLLGQTSDLYVSPEMDLFVWRQMARQTNGKQMSLYVNGEPLNIPPFISLQKVVFTGDGGYIASLITTENGNKKTFLLVNDVVSIQCHECPPEALSVSGDARHWAVGITYIQGSDELEETPISFVYYDGRLQKGFHGRVKMVRLSDNGEHLAVVVERQDNDSGYKKMVQVYLDGEKKGSAFRDVHNLVFSSDGKDLYWNAEQRFKKTKNTRLVLVKNGDVIGEKVVGAYAPILGKKRSQVAWIENRKNRDQFLFTGCRQYGPLEHIKSPHFNAAGNIAFAATHDGQTRLYVDGTPMGPEAYSWFGISSITWNPDGSHLAAVIQKERNECLIVEDGKVLNKEPFQRVFHMQYSPDGSRLAAMVERKDGKVRVWEKGKKGGPWRSGWRREFPLLFSLDSKDLFAFYLDAKKNIKLFKNHRQNMTKGSVAPELFFSDSGKIRFMEIVGEREGVLSVKAL